MMQPDRPGFLRDLLYFDVNKAASILSQLEGGLLTSSQETSASASTIRKGLTGDLKFVKGERETSEEDSATESKSRVLHHATLNRLESLLEASGEIFRCSHGQMAQETPSALRDMLLSRPFVTISAPCIMQDYNELDRILSHFNDLSGFINRSTRHSLEQTEEFKALQSQIAQLREASKAPRIGTQERAIAKDHLKHVEQTLDSMIGSLTQSESLPDWFIAGIRLFLDSFMRGRIELRLQPLTAHPEFEIVASLRRDSFIDASAADVLHSYGSRPGPAFTAFGFVTSGRDDAEQRAQRKSAVGDVAGAFDTMFAALDALEDAIATVHPPSVALFPVAVFRDLRMN